jgi:hypothetical protein
MKRITSRLALLATMAAPILLIVAAAAPRIRF